MPKRPGEKVILKFIEEAPKRYTMVHFNKDSPKTLNIHERLINGNQLIAEYSVGKDRPIGPLGERYIIGKCSDVTKGIGISDVLVVPEGDSIEEKLYNLALVEAQKYAESRGLDFEDQTNFQPDFP